MSLKENSFATHLRLRADDACAPASGSAAAVRAHSTPVLGVLAREALLVLAGTVVIALIGQLRVPLPFTPVSITLGTLAVLGVGSVLGSRRGAASALLLAAAALAGIPVLTGFMSGVTATFGYVLGYTPAAAVAGLAGRTASWPRRLALLLLASAIVYVPGMAWLAVATGAPLSSLLGMGLVPFLVGDLLKSLLASVIPTRLGRRS